MHKHKMNHGLGEWNYLSESSECYDITRCSIKKGKSFPKLDSGVNMQIINSNIRHLCPNLETSVQNRTQVQVSKCLNKTYVSKQDTSGQNQTLVSKSGH